MDQKCDAGEPVAWEHFCDHSYYGMWCVHQKDAPKTFGDGYHVTSEAEAISLAALLNSALIASPPPANPAQVTDAMVEAVAWWHVGKWGNGTSCADESNIFCDAWETAIAENLPTEIAEAIVEAHNAALSQPHPADEQVVEAREQTFYDARGKAFDLPTPAALAAKEGQKNG